MGDSGLQSMLESTPMGAHGEKFKPRTHRALMQLNAPSPIVPIHSSTLNDSLVSSVDLWNLKITPSVTPSASATTSPAEFYKNHQESLQKTPLKIASTSKLGSPERNEIISGRKPTARCILTPKLERSSPAKKRLFGLHNINGGGGVGGGRSLLAAHSKHDPVNYFLGRRKVPMVMEQIFGELKDCDLYNCRRVSGTWRAAVDSFPGFRRSAQEFGKKVDANRENPEALKRLMAKSEGERSFTNYGDDKFIQLGRTLTGSQSLRKCPHCESPQIVEYSIAQCLTCGYVCCVKCGSHSHDGPAHFVDKCNSGALTLPPSLRRRATLMDSPPRAQHSFLSSSSFGNLSNQSVASDNSHLYASSSASKDSCYWSYDRSSFAHSPNDASVALGDVSNRHRSVKRNFERESLDLSDAARRHAKAAKLYAPVVQLRKSPAKGGADESPEKDYSKYRGVGTQASRRRLRRL